MLYCFQEKETGALQCLREGNWSSIDLWRRKLVLYCFQEKGTGAISTDLRRKLVQHCSQEKETAASYGF